jgi:hypothetical protein
MVVALADDASVAYDNRTDRRVRRRVADAASREFVRTLQVDFVEFG